ncbi:MAG: TolC family protein [Deltaproteobacteria bacterium]|nr:TolC family protein [Deltaproteobacteria bacterium]
MKENTAKSVGAFCIRSFKIQDLTPLLLLAVMYLMPHPCSALTLDEAISLAKMNLPSYKAQLKRLDSTEALYRVSLGTFFPRLDVTGSSTRYDTTSGNYDSNNYDVTLSYKLFEGFEGVANRNISKYNLEIDREELSKNLLDLEFNIKGVFYTSLALKEVEKARKLQLEDAKKDYDVADGRYKLGVVKLSDLLQASVRLEQAKFNLIETEGNLRKAIAELYSLIGIAHDTSYDLEGGMEGTVTLPDREKLTALVLERPEMKQAEYTLKKSESSNTLARGEFWPALSADLSYSRAEDSGLLDEDYTDKSARIVATWNLFELGKFYREKSSRAEINVAEENLREMRRQLLLDFEKYYEDFVTASNNIAVARQQLTQAEQNYNQAFWEYKVGKGDILSLVVAEDLLAGARQQTATSRLNLMIAKSQLERVTGLDRLESQTGVTPPSNEQPRHAEGQ